MITIIFNLSIKLHALEKSRELNCQFDSCNFIPGLDPSLSKFEGVFKFKKL